MKIEVLAWKATFTANQLTSNATINYYSTMNLEREGYEEVPLSTEPKKEEHKELTNVTGSAAYLLTVALLVFLAILLYEMTTRIYALSTKEADMQDLMGAYQHAIGSLSRKIGVINTTAGLFTKEDLEQYSLIVEKLQRLESLIAKGRQGSDEEEANQQLMPAIESAERDADERAAVIGMLLAHSKEEIRKRKIEMIQKVAKKNDFQEQKIRNPWAMSRLNLRTPFIDTLEKRHMEQEVQKEMERLESTYHFSMFEKELPICVIVSTRNNAKNYRYEYNLQSILNQNYQNYKLIVVDDASEDGTGDLVKIFLRNSKLPPERYFVVQNKERMTAVPNIKNAIVNYCSKNDIAVLISGDDQLLGKQVFKILNVVYQTKKPGVAYTNHFYGKLHENDFEKGYSRAYTLGEIKNKLYRFIGQKFGHMRTFAVSLFLEIKEQHMKYRDGRWVDATYDETFLLPMLEMACDSIEYIDEYVYLYNYGTGENDGEIHHDIQAGVAHYIRELPRYSCIPKYQKYVI